MEQVVIKQKLRSEDLGSSKRDRGIDLHKRYPISRRWIIRQLFGWMTLFVLALIASILWSPELFFLQGKNRFIDLPLFAQKKFIILAGLGFVIASKSFQYELMRRSLIMQLEGKRLSVRQGIILREWASVPLTQFTEVYIRQNLGDRIFGIATVEITLPSRRQGQEGVCIQGLSSKSAHSLQRMIEHLLIDGQDEKKASGSQFQKRSSRLSKPWRRPAAFVPHVL